MAIKEWVFGSANGGHRKVFVADLTAELPSVNVSEGDSGYSKEVSGWFTRTAVGWSENGGSQGPAGPEGPPGADGITTVRAIKTSDQTNIGTSYADVTGLSLALLANKSYAFEFMLLCDSDATTTGIDVAVNGPASPTTIAYEQVYWTSATARTERGATAYDANTGSTGSNGTATRPYRIKGVVRNGANAGNLVPRAKREAVGTGPNVRAGSYGIAFQLD